MRASQRASVDDEDEIGTSILAVDSLQLQCDDEEVILAQCTDSEDSSMAPGANQCGGTIGLLLMAGSAVSFAMMSFLIHILGRPDDVIEGATAIPSVELVGIRAAFGLVIATSIATQCNAVDAMGPKEMRPLLVTRGCVGLVAMLVNWYILTQMPLGDATVIIFSAPVFTTVLANLFLGEAVSAVEGVAMLLSCTGVVCVARPSVLFGAEAEASQGDGKFDLDATTRFWLVLLGLGGAVASAVTNLLVRKLVGVDAFVTVSYLMCAGLMASLFWGVTIGEPVLPHGAAQWPALGGVVVLGFVGQICKTQGLKWEKAGPGSMMRNLDLVFAFVFQTFLLGESVHPLSVVGASLTCTGSLGIGLSKLYKSKQAKDEEGERVEVEESRDGGGEVVYDAVGAVSPRGGVPEGDAHVALKEGASG